MSALDQLARRGADGDAAHDLDVLTVGRVGLDLYAREHDTDFAHVSGFDKHVGGSPGLIALGLARLGKRAGILTRVSDDMVGRYVAGLLADRGVDVSQLQFDASGTRTSLALTEMKADGCGVVIYRNDAADLALSRDDIDEARLKRTRALVVSGTALSREPSRTATLRAMDLALGVNAPVVLDLDYRAYTWASTAEAGETYRAAARRAAVLIGNREEFEVLGMPATASAEEVASRCLGGTVELVMVKAGGDGSDVFHADGTTVHQPIFEVAVTKPFGAGDAYCAATLDALLDGRTLAEAVRRGAAAAAIVVAGDSCDDAMPDTATLNAFLESRS